MDEKKTTTTTLRLDTDLLDLLREMAEREDRSLNAQIVRLLRLAIEQQPARG